MSEGELYWQTRNSWHRYLVDKVDDEGKENYHDIEGMDGHEPTKVLHIQPHGFSSISPKGSHGVGIHMGHNYDMMAFLGGEHPDHKPKKLGAGNTALYNADGTIMKMIGKDITLDAKGTMTKTLKELVIKCGDVTMTINKDGVKIKGGKVTHDDHNIGSTHKHKNAGGIGLSGEPDES